MKKTILILVILSVGATFTSYAQEKTSAPRSEFTLTLSESSLTVKPGETKKVTLGINPSKSYSKSTVKLGLSSGLPQGITVSFEPSEGVITSSEAIISIDESAKPGNYVIILSSTIQSKSKGATLKLIVTDPSGAVVSKN